MSTFQAEWAGGGLRNGAPVEGLGWEKSLRQREHGAFRDLDGFPWPEHLGGGDQGDKSDAQGSSLKSSNSEGCFGLLDFIFSSLGLAFSSQACDIVLGPTPLLSTICQAQNSMIPGELLDKCRCS